MVRSFLKLVFVFITFSGSCLACECIGIERPCENLRSDVVFVGRVIETNACLLMNCIGTRWRPEEIKKSLSVIDSDKAFHGISR